ncbi:MAG: hypothetical protein JW774_06490 [Candidatus Aureabacteria bacterium]|nr:hypothetical protein [Candidatus Auribacterota bacterium]
MQRFIFFSIGISIFFLSSNVCSGDSENASSFFSNHIVAFYNFEEGKGKVVQDQSGFQNIAYLKKRGTHSSFTTGKFGWGIATNPDLGPLMVPFSSTLNSNESTSVLFWIKPFSLGKQTLFSIRKNDQKEYYLHIKEEDGSLYLEVRNENDPVPQQTSKQKKLAVQQWHHIVFTHESGKKKVSLYMDGEKLGEVVCINGIPAGDLFFGGAADCLTGVIDECYVLNESLSPEYIQNFYQFNLARISEDQKRDFMDKNSLKMYFPLDEKTKEVPKNYVSGTFTAAVSGYGIRWDEGIVSGSLVFSSNKDKMTVEEYPADTFSSDFSVTMWVYPHSFEEKIKLLSCFSPDNNKLFFLFGLDDKYLYTAMGDGEQWETVKSMKKMELNTWQLCSLIYRRNENKLELYQDTEKVASFSLTITRPALSFPIRIGYGIKTETFTGKLDEIKVYAKALTMDEISKEYGLINQPLFQSPRASTKEMFPSSKKMIAYYPFDYDSPLYITDYSNAGHVAYFKDRLIALFNEGYSEGGLDLNGDKGAMIIPASYYFDYLKDVTISMWIKPHSFGDRRKIFARHDTDNLKQLLFLGENQGRIYFGLGDGKKYQLFYCDNSLKLGEWQHIVVTYQYETNIVRLYVNGTLSKEEISKNHFAGLADLDTTVGADYKGKEAFFDGTLDDLRIYASFFNPEEIQTLYKKSLSLKVEKKPSEVAMVTPPEIKAVEPSPGLESVPLPPASVAVKAEEKPAVQEAKPAVTPPVSLAESPSTEEIKKPVSERVSPSVPDSKSIVSSTPTASIPKMTVPPTQEGRLQTEVNAPLTVSTETKDSDIPASSFKVDVSSATDLEMRPSSSMITDTKTLSSPVKKSVPDRPDRPDRIQEKTPSSPVEEDHAVADLSDSQKELEQKILNQKRVMQSEMKLRLKNYHELKPIFKLPSKLNKIPFYKSHHLFVHYDFETSDYQSMNDEFNSGVVFSMETSHHDHAMPGILGLGLYIKPYDSVFFSQIELRMPRVFGMEFSLYPMDLSPLTKMAFLTFMTEDKKEIAQFYMHGDRLILNVPDKNTVYDTQLLFIEKAWQNVVISYDSESKSFYFMKNNRLLKAIPFPQLFPSRFSLCVGKWQNRLTTEFILDEMKFYRYAFKEETDFPTPPQNPVMMIQEGKKIKGSEFNVLLFCENATEFMVCYHPEFVGGKWEPYKHQVPLKTKMEGGDQTLYCKFKNRFNLESQSVSVTYSWEGEDHSKIQFINPLRDSSIPGKR